MNPTLFTLPELVRILKRAEPRLTATARQLRYQMEAFERMNTAHRPRGRGDSARFSVGDCALLLLVLQIIAACGHRIAWATFTYLGDPIHERLRTGHPAGYVAIADGRAELVTAQQVSRLPQTAWVFSLADLWTQASASAAVEVRKRGKAPTRVPQWKDPELVGTAVH